MIRYLSSFESIRQRYHHLSSHQERGVYFVSDRANWAFDQITSSLILRLTKTFGLRAHKSRYPWRLTGQIIHFINRYAFLKGPHQDLHPSNQVFLNWFHGGESESGSAFTTLLDTLLNGQHVLNKVVVPCTITQQVLLDYGILEDKIVVIPIGVDLDLFKPLRQLDRIRIRKELGIPQNTICIGSFQKDGAGWGEGHEPKFVKGPDIFLNVIDRLSKVYSNLHVLLTGPARGYVKQGLESLGIAYTHQFVTDYRDMADYYNALDLYLITSRSEGGPMSLLESWASGVPVVSTRVGMAADLIKHKKNGLIGDIGDTESLTEFTMMVVNDDSLRSRLRQQSLVDVRQYDWIRITNRYYTELYQPLL